MTRFRKEKADEFILSNNRGDLVRVVLADKYEVSYSNSENGGSRDGWRQIVEKSSPRGEREVMRSPDFEAHYHGFGTSSDGIRNLSFNLPNGFGEVSVLEHCIKEVELYAKQETISFRSET